MLYNAIYFVFTNTILNRFIWTEFRDTVNSTWKCKQANFRLPK